MPPFFTIGNIAGLLISATLAIVGILRRYLTISDQLKDALIAEIVGGGVTALAIGILLLYIQRRGQTTEQVSSGKAFIEGTLIVDIYEAAKRGASLWNLGRGRNNKFYFDNTIVNHLYDVVRGHSERISRYRQVLPTNEILNQSRKLELAIRDGYVIGERLDTILHQIIREGHAKRGVHPANDDPVLSYIKAKLFADLTDDQVVIYLAWPQISEERRQLFEVAYQNDNVKTHVNVLSDMRASLVTKAEELIKLAAEELKIPKN